jgi:hypothetical protein
MFAALAAAAAILGSPQPAAARGQTIDPVALVQWATVTKSLAGAGTLTKIAGCDGCADAGAISQHRLPPGDGSVEFIPAYGHRLYAGLADAATTLPSPASLPYAFSFWADGGWDVRERGVYKTEGRLAAGDVFRIAVTPGTVRYFRNGQLVYKNAAAVDSSLRFGVALYSTNASIAAAGLAVPYSGPALATYDAVVDRETRLEPILPVAGPAGTTIADPAFGTTLRRITDAFTRPGKPGRSFRTPSGTHQHAWSAAGSYFYVVSNDGTIMPYAFDGRTGQASRIQPTAAGEGGLTLKFFNEAQFSYVSDAHIYATYNGSGATLRTVDQYDFSTGLYTRLLDLDTVAPDLQGTLVAGLGSSAGAVEKILTFFGGSMQDQHHYIVVFEKGNPSRRRLLDSTASTIDGVPTAVPLNFKLHHAAIDRSGRYVLLYPASVDLVAPRRAEHVYVWDTQVDLITPIVAQANPNGHDAPGYETLVNQDCCTSTTWDAAQWQRRSLSAPLATRDLILPVLLPKHIYMADHPSWHNARPDLETPFLSALYRYGGEASPWRAWDDEIVAVQTNVSAGASATVWRLAHHRSDIGNDNDPSRIYFWYTPRPSVSPDGRWVLFTSNWEKTLGPDPVAEPGGAFRQDVFLLKAR